MESSKQKYILPIDISYIQNKPLDKNSDTPKYVYDEEGNKIDVSSLENGYGCHWYEQIAAASCDSFNCQNCGEDGCDPSFSCTCGCYATFHCKYPGCDN